MLLPFLIALGIAIAFLTGAMTALNYDALPDRIPMHFGLTGEPTGYGPKAGAWMMPVVQVSIFVIEALAYTQRHLPLRALWGMLLIANAVALALFASQWLIIETAKHGPSWKRYRTFLFALALTLAVVPVSIAFGK
jgi:thiol:disulfide interchange protein